MKTEPAVEIDKTNVELLKRLAQEVNRQNGGLDYLEVYEFDDEFFNMMFEGKPMEAVRAAHFGEIDSWNDEYIRFNGYGNLESLSDYAYEKELLNSADEIAEAAQDIADEIDLESILEEYSN